MSELRDKVEMEIQHNISPLIGWLRFDASKGKVDTDGARLGQWEERAGRAVDAIMEHVGEVEYEYAIQALQDGNNRWVVSGKFLAYGFDDHWDTREERQSYLEELKEDNPERTFRLVKRRKAGRIEDV